MDGSRRAVNLLGAAACVWIAGYWIIAADGPGRDAPPRARPVESAHVSPLAALSEEVEETAPATRTAPEAQREAEAPSVPELKVPEPDLKVREPGVVKTPGPAEVERPKSPPEPEVIHVVVQGDTLSRLSTRYYGSSAWADRIFEANRDILNSPHDLAIGQRLRIPPKP